MNNPLSTLNCDEKDCPTPLVHYSNVEELRMHKIKVHGHPDSTIAAQTRETRHEERLEKDKEREHIRDKVMRDEAAERNAYRPLPHEIACKAGASMAGTIAGAIYASAAKPGTFCQTPSKAKQAKEAKRSKPVSGKVDKGRGKLTVGTRGLKGVKVQGQVKAQRQRGSCAEPKAGTSSAVREEEMEQDVVLAPPTAPLEDKGEEGGEGHDERPENVGLSPKDKKA